MHGHMNDKKVLVEVTLLVQKLETLLLIRLTGVGVSLLFSFSAKSTVGKNRDSDSVYCVIDPLGNN